MKGAGTAMLDYPFDTQLLIEGEGSPRPHGLLARMDGP